MPPRGNALETWRGIHPVSAWKSITPTAYQSLASVTFRPAACSGAMYAGVPAICVDVPTPSERRGSTSPKSRTTTRPDGSTRTFDGFRSRWSLRARWSAATPSASCRMAPRRRSIPAASSGRTGIAVAIASRTAGDSWTVSDDVWTSRFAIATGASSRTCARKSRPRTSSIVKNH